MDNYEEELLKKIDSDKDLSEDELNDLLDWELCEHRDDYDERRWVMGTYSIIKIGDRHFGLCWDRALTEMQEPYFHSQPEEVEQYEETITVTKWRTVK